LRRFQTLFQHKVSFSSEAKASFREIALYIAGDNKTRAISFVRELRAKAQQLGTMPLAFPLVPGMSITNPIGFVKRDAPQGY
jgi:plasmid stabilization system protein ParE